MLKPFLTPHTRDKSDPNIEYLTGKGRDMPIKQTAIVSRGEISITRSYQFISASSAARAYLPVFCPSWQDRTAILGGIPPIFRLKWYPILAIYISAVLVRNLGGKTEAWYPHLPFFCPHVYGFRLFSAYAPLIFRLRSAQFPPSFCLPLILRWMMMCVEL